MKGNGNSKGEDGNKRSLRSDLLVVIITVICNTAALM